MKIFKMLTALAAFFAVALFSGCDDDKRPEPDPQPDEEAPIPLEPESDGNRRIVKNNPIFAVT